MPGLETEELLKDARLVMDYAVRTGHLPDDALPKAVKTVEASPTGAPTHEIASLATALNHVIRAIAPMTLVDLRAGRNPFDARNQKAARRLQAFLCVLAIALTGVVAYFTQYLHQEATALKALDQIENTHVLDKLNAVRKMAQFEKVLDKQDRQYDEYQRTIRELRNLQDKISGSYDLLKSVAERAPLHFVGRLGFSSSSTADSYSAEYEKVVANASKLASVPTGTPMSVVGTPPPLDSCDPNAKDSLWTRKDYDPWLKKVIADSIDQVCFSTRLNLLFELRPTSLLSYRIQASMATLNGWVLPFLYGLLGAVFFLMRNSLDLRNPNFDSFSVILRIALGGIAGIIIGWFWVPAASKPAEIATITSAPFGLAFLTGFSIDVLFSLLDRINKTISDPPATMPKVATMTT